MSGIVSGINDAYVAIVDVIIGYSEGMDLMDSIGNGLRCGQALEVSK